MENISDFAPQANILVLLKVKEVRERARERKKMYFRAEQCFLAYMVAYKQNQEEADRMETLTPPSLPAGRRGAARELSSKTNNSCSHADVVFLPPRSFSKEALKSMNPPGCNLDDSGLTAMSTSCHLE